MTDEQIGRVIETLTDAFKKQDNAIIITGRQNEHGLQIKTQIYWKDTLQCSSVLLETAMRCCTAGLDDPGMTVKKGGSA